MQITSIVGARPQFIKAAPLVREIAKRHASSLIHTGQHYDAAMSDVFFDELALPPPDHHLGVGSGPHGAQTAAMLERVAPILERARPDWVIVFGDTNSTLAGALAASKLRIKVAHVEAGLRSFNRTMPEEINRLIADQVSDLLLCPGEGAVDNLAREGIRAGVHVVGDLMAEALDASIARANERSTILDRLGLQPKQFLLLTVHRAATADDAAAVARVIDAVAATGETAIFPVHPRTRRALDAVSVPPNVRLVGPVGYLDMIRLQSAARMVLTDSGGMQKEAYWLGTPCVTLRDETEWPETVSAGWNMLVGTDRERLVSAIRSFRPDGPRPPLYGGAGVAARIVSILEASNGSGR